MNGESIIAVAAALALSAPAWASGNDHFNAGIDAGRPGSSFGSNVSTGSTSSDVDHEGGRLTDSDRQMIASLTNGAWGKLVSIANNVATFNSGREGGFITRHLQLAPNPPAPRPAAPRPIAARAVPPAAPAPQPAAPSFTPTTPAFDMGTISAPPLELAAVAPPAPPQPSVAPPEMQQPAAQLSLPERAAPKRRGYGGLEQTLRARIPVDRRLPGAKLSRPGEAEVAATVNAAAGFGVGAVFGNLPGGGKVYKHGTVRGVIENGLIGAALAETRRRAKGGRTPYDEQVREVMNMGDRKIEALARDMEGNMSPRQVERFTEAFKRERRQYEARERAAARQDGQQREHGR